MINTKKLCGIDLNTTYNGDYQKDIKLLKKVQIFTWVIPVIGFLLSSIILNDEKPATNKTPDNIAKKTQTYYKTSFDCTKADSYVEKTICSDQNLAKLDIELSNTYKAKLAKTKNKQKLQSQQKNWILNTENQCKDEKCITDTITQRIRALSRVIPPKNKPI